MNVFIRLAAAHINIQKSSWAEDGGKLIFGIGLGRPPYACGLLGTVIGAPS